MIESVSFISQRDVQLLGPDSRLAIVSITDDADALIPQCDSYVRLRFLDISPDVNCGYIPTADFYSYHEGVMCPGQAVMLKMFLDRVMRAPHLDKLVVHCYHGRFRSASVALYLSEHYGVPIDRPVTHRNEHVYKILNDPYYVEKETKKKK